MDEHERARRWIRYHRPVNWRWSIARTFIADRNGHRVLAEHGTCGRSGRLAYRGDVREMPADARVREYDAMVLAIDRELDGDAVLPDHDAAQVLLWASGIRTKDESSEAFAGRLADLLEVDWWSAWSMVWASARHLGDVP